MIVEKIIDRIEETDIGNRSLDLVLLDHLDLTRPHQKVKTQEGKTVAISLPLGEQLYKGAVLYSDEEEIIAVDLLEEDVFEIKPKGNIEWARVAFNIGNMHQPAYVTENDICIPFDPVMERMFRSLNVEYSRKKRKLDGLRANVSISSAGHHHSHEHTHNHSGSHQTHEHPHDHTSDHQTHEHSHDHSGSRQDLEGHRHE